jgi:hypothetical protein
MFWGRGKVKSDQNYPKPLTVLPQSGATEGYRTLSDAVLEGTGSPASTPGSPFS